MKAFTHKKERWKTSSNAPFIWRVKFPVSLIYEYYPESLKFSKFVESKIKRFNRDSLKVLTFGN